ncbi:hypothetical protein BASA50_001833 [Batrachochytrium salamandrivorans]|uniref:Copper transporter n=1 Tax=Batrachochytrium salamandrivorans TaxID=1357716 RepID=A0ABQ8FN89_9FUNG|nr:hypothetical protein BASA50_001833 [Batrachochytrium salamandrivorans]KAH9274987.1 hypothetical protein BASA83_002699 [Batrachochytrium salamandrivorans]
MNSAVMATTTDTTTGTTTGTTTDTTTDTTMALATAMQVVTLGELQQKHYPASRPTGPAVCLSATKHRPYSLYSSNHPSLPALLLVLLAVTPLSLALAASVSSSHTQSNAGTSISPDKILGHTLGHIESTVGKSTASSDTLAPTPDCINDPTAPICQSYQLPSANVSFDLDTLCSSMPNMPGCSIRKSCSLLPTSRRWYCKEFSILADVCAKDMPGMRGCGSYTKMCKTGSVIKQCYDEPPIAYLPTTKRAKQLVQEICADMYMTGCEKCQPSGMCPGFDVYGELCQSMPDMPQCDELKRMCRQEPSISICPLDSGHDNNDDDSSPDSPNHQSGPLMKMFFHFGYSDYVLFDFWVPRTAISYALACMFCFVVAFAYEGLLVISIHLELQWENMLSKRLIYSTSMKDALDSDSSNDDIIVNGPSSITNVNSGIFEDDAPLLRPRSRNGRTRTQSGMGPISRFQSSGDSPLMPVSSMLDADHLQKAGPNDPKSDWQANDASAHSPREGFRQLSSTTNSMPSTSTAPIITHIPTLGPASDANRNNPHDQGHNSDRDHHSARSPLSHPNQLYLFGQNSSRHHASKDGSVRKSSQGWIGVQIRVGRALLRLFTVTGAYIYTLEMLCLSFRWGVSPQLHIISVAASLYLGM